MNDEGAIEIHRVGAMFDSSRKKAVSMVAVYIVRSTVEPDFTTEWLRWQNEEHIAALLALPGYLDVQRYVEADDPGRFLNIWRLAARDAHGTAAYEKASLTPWFRRVRPHYEVEVDFSDERPSDATISHRRKAVSLVVERAATRTPEDVERFEQLLDDEYEAELRRNRGVLSVVHLDPLEGREDPIVRSASSAVLLIYLRDPDEGRNLLRTTPAHVERRSYRVLDSPRRSPRR